MYFAKGVLDNQARGPRFLGRCSSINLSISLNRARFFSCAHWEKSSHSRHSSIFSSSVLRMCTCERAIHFIVIFPSCPKHSFILHLFGPSHPVTDRRFRASRSERDDVSLLQSSRSSHVSSQRRSRRCSGYFRRRCRIFTKANPNVCSGSGLRLILRWLPAHPSSGRARTHERLDRTMPRRHDALRRCNHGCEALLRCIARRCSYRRLPPPLCPAECL